MLVYHPAFDIYHGIYRQLLLLSRMTTDRVEIDRLRIWDFYLVFPTEAKEIAFPSELVKLKRIFKDTPNPYEDIADGKKMFEQLRPYQLLSLKCLASYELIDANALSENYVMRTANPIPEAIVNELALLSDWEDNIIKLVTSPFKDLPLYGQKGLKFRTGLIEFKYDNR